MRRFNAKKTQKFGMKSDSFVEVSSCVFVGREQFRACTTMV